jgi:hypothetical protein
LFVEVTQNDAVCPWVITQIFIYLATLNILQKRHSVTAQEIEKPELCILKIHFRSHFNLTRIL